MVNLELGTVDSGKSMSEILKDERAWLGRADEGKSKGYEMG